MEMLFKRKEQQDYFDYMLSLKVAILQVADVSAILDDHGSLMYCQSTHCSLHCPHFQIHLPIYQAQLSRLGYHKKVALSRTPCLKIVLTNLQLCKGLQKIFFVSSSLAAEWIIMEVFGKGLFLVVWFSGSLILLESMRLWISCLRRIQESIE